MGKMIEKRDTGIMRETNQEDEQDVTDNHQASILSISASQYVFMASVGVSYKSMHLLSVVMDNWSASHVLSWDVFTFDWQRYDIRDAKFTDMGDANENPQQIQHEV